MKNDKQVLSSCDERNERRAVRAAHGLRRASKIFVILGLATQLLTAIIMSGAEPFPEVDPIWGFRIVILLVYGMAGLTSLSALALLCFVVRTVKGILWLVVILVLSGVMLIGEGVAAYTIHEFGYR